MASQPVHDGSADQENLILEASQPIINRLSKLADEQVRRKALIEQRWLDDLRMYFGRYDENIERTLVEEQRSTAFVKLTRNKTNSWAARIGDILFPTDDKNWGIMPTPVPSLVQKAKEAVKKAEATVEVANETTDPAQQARVKEMADSFAQDARNTQAEIEEAKKRCDAMDKAILDQLTEADYVTECRDVIEDGCRLGTGILKGPMTSQRLRAQWRETQGSWGLVQIPDPMPEYHRVDPWHFFPDMSAGRVREMEFTFERHLPTRKDLRRLARKLNFNRAVVGRLLEDGPGDYNVQVDHLAMLRTITGEGDMIKDRFVMWEYHGPLEFDEVCMLLRAAGQLQKAEDFEASRDPLEDYRVIIHFCNNEVLKIAPEYPLDSGEGLYSVWNFEKGETSVFGLGVPNIMSDSQRAVNSAWRMMMDNAALSVGPQILMNRNMVTPQDGSYTLRPLKVWLLSSTAGITPNSKPFEAFPIAINQQALAGIIELAKAFIDEETGMPTIAQGEQGASTKTLGGMSILFNSANVVFRRVVKMWDDDLTKPTIRRAYDWNMQFNPDDGVKGDMQVDARGSSVLLVREMQSQSLMNIMTNWTTHPVMGPWFTGKVRGGIAKTLQTLMIDPEEMLATQDEYDKEMQKQAEQTKDQPSDPNAIKLQIAQAEQASREKIVGIQEDGAKAIAQMNYEIAAMRLQQETGMKRQEIDQKFGLAHAELGSKERMKAVDISVEDRRAREAQARGDDPAMVEGKGVG